MNKQKNLDGLVSVQRSNKQGKGVFATQKIFKNKFILSIDDSHIVNDESKLTTQQHEYDLDYVDGKMILMQSPEKYINHSCNPNVFVKTVKGVRNLYAIRSILKGGEIVYDYAVNGDNEGTFECTCGSANCRKIYQGDFFKLPIEIQIKYLPYLDTWFIEKYSTRIRSLLI